MELGADKTKNFWCVVNLTETFSDNHKFAIIIKHIEDNLYKLDIWNEYLVEQDNIIWHPITYWRLKYLRFTSTYCDDKSRIKVVLFFSKNVDLYDKNILERPEEFCQNILLTFLQSM